MDAKAYAEHRNLSGAMVTKYLQNGFIPSANKLEENGTLTQN